MTSLLLSLFADDVTFLILSIHFLVLNDGYAVIFPSLKSVLDQSSHLMTAVWVLGHTARFGRNWIAVVVAIDRFVVVNNPLTASQRSSPMRATIYSIVVTIIAFLFDLPRIWELNHERVYNNCTGTYSLNTNYNPALPNPLRILYSGVMHVAFVVLIPIALLTVFNTLLTVSLVRASRLRAQLSPEGASRVQETRMLVVVIAVFVVTEMPACIVQTVVTSFWPFYNRYRAVWQAIQEVSNFFTATNSSANFAIYCLCGRRFRKNMYQMLRRANPCKTPPRTRYETINGQRVSLRSPVTIYSHVESTRHRSQRYSDSRLKETVM